MTKGTELKDPRGRIAENYIAETYGIPIEHVIEQLDMTCFMGAKDMTYPEKIQFMLYAKSLNLNPFAREIYAFSSGGKVVPIVAYDGWTKIYANHPKTNGMKIVYSDKMIQIDGSKPCYEWIEVHIFRKGEEHSTPRKLWFEEWFVKNPNWKSYTKHRFETRGICQAVRLAFGLSNLYDESVVERGYVDEEDASNDFINVTPPKNIDALRDALEKEEDELKKPIDEDEDDAPPPPLPTISEEERLMKECDSLVSMVTKIIRDKNEPRRQKFMAWEHYQTRKAAAIAANPSFESIILGKEQEALEACAPAAETTAQEV